MDRRYLYLSAYDIVESDGVESFVIKDSEKESTPPPTKNESQPIPPTKEVSEQLPQTPVNENNPLGLGEELPTVDIETFSKMERLVRNGKRNYTGDIELKYSLTTSQKLHLKNAEDERNK